jgi:hypothetical protein
VASQEVGLHIHNRYASWSAYRWNMWAGSRHIAAAAHRVNGGYEVGNEQSDHLFLTAKRTGQRREGVRGHARMTRRTGTGGTLRLFAKAKDADQGLRDHRNTRGLFSTGDTDHKLVTQYHTSGRGSMDADVRWLRAELTTFRALQRRT